MFWIFRSKETRLLLLLAQQELDRMRKEGKQARVADNGMGFIGDERYHEINRLISELVD